MNARVKKVTLHNKTLEQTINSTELYNTNNSKNDPLKGILYFELSKNLKNQIME